MSIKIINHIETLLWYDGPLLVLCKDNEGQEYVCRMTDDNHPIVDFYDCVSVIDWKQKTEEDAQRFLENFDQNKTILAVTFDHVEFCLYQKGE